MFILCRGIWVFVGREYSLGYFYHLGLLTSVWNPNSIAKPQTLKNKDPLFAFFENPQHCKDKNSPGHSEVSSVTGPSCFLSKITYLWCLLMLQDSGIINSMKVQLNCPYSSITLITIMVELHSYTDRNFDITILGFHITNV